MKYVILAIALSLLLFGCAQVETKACTQEAKLCPDGSAVGRTGPNCEFAACPAAGNGSANATLANPAAVYCIAHNATWAIHETPQGQDGYCTFPDGTVCEEWAYFRGECAANASK